MKPLKTPLVVLLVCGSIHAEPISAKPETKSHPLVTALSGDLPIILSAPHGGRDAVPDVPPRQGNGVANFNPKSDSNTDRLTEELADAIAKISGKRPYVVIARFHRKFIDANRPPDSAYEAEQAKPVYDAYQQALADARQKIIARWGGGILLDIHGQASAPDTIIRGTQNGKTTTHLIKRFGKEALAGGKSLFGQLAKQGFTVVPPAGSPDRETRYTGGHIVATTGSASGGTFDAIQLELGSNLRSATQRAQTAGRMAGAVVAYATDYLPKEEIEGNAGAEPGPPKKIMVGVYQDEGAGPSANDLTRALAEFENITFQNQQLLKNPHDSLKIHYAQGPLLAPANNPEIPDYETLATFKTEIALNGAPKGVMPGTTAAARGQFGRGRVICFSPHPEMTQGLEDLVKHAINFVGRSSSTDRN